MTFSDERKMEDFVVDTDGHCFFCLEKLSVQANVVGKVVRSSPTHSLQYLSRYLKMNRRKIFNDEESIPPDLLAEVEKSRLTADLCEECVQLNGQFSGLFRLLEMTELKIESCLDLILAKLGKANKTYRTDELCKYSRAEAGPLGKQKIVQALRAEARQKCSQKLNGVQPKIKVRNMKMQEIQQKKINLKLNSNDNKRRQLQEVKVDEQHYSQHDYDDDDGNSFTALGDFNDSDQPAMETGYRPEYESLETDNSTAHDTAESSSVPTAFLANPLENKISYEGKFSKSNSGKYSCKDCSKEYANCGAFRRHYKGEHLKIKFRCVPCGKEFARKDQFIVHKQSAHMRVRFKCDRCDGMYTSKTNLDSHRRSAHFGGRFPCNFCPMTFENFKDRDKHMSVECQSKRVGMNQTGGDAE